jgi:predicted amidophosphoribosyltransferase
VGAYVGPLREAVHALKYHGRHGVAASLAALLAPAVAPFLQEGDLLVPVPLHSTRERERGYNQAAILASELQYLLPVEVAPGALRRTRATADQTALSSVQRAANVRGAFTAPTDAVSGRRIWLLDDFLGYVLRAGFVRARRVMLSYVGARRDGPRGPSSLHVARWRHRA